LDNKIIKQLQPYYGHSRWLVRCIVLGCSPILTSGDNFGQNDKRLPMLVADKMANLLWDV